MSKNFELIQQGERVQGRPVTTELMIDTPAPIGQKSRYAKEAPFSLVKMTQEELLKLVQSIFLSEGKESPRVVVFAGIDSGNGCSEICARSAKILAGQKGLNVCLVDANLRSPSLPAFFGVDNHYGLTDALRKDGSIREFARQVSSDNLWLLSGGSLSGSSSLVNSDLVKGRFAELRKEFDYVLIDSPPLSTYSDGYAVGQLADGLVLVLEANSTRRQAAARVTENLRAAQIRILGAVLNKRTFPIPQVLYNLL